MLAMLLKRLHEAQQQSGAQNPASHIILYRTWLAALAFAVVALFFSLWQGFSFPSERIVQLLALLAGMQLLAFGPMLLRMKDAYKIFILLQYIAIFTLNSLSGALYTYTGASLALPLVDEALIRADALLGFNWLAYVHWLAQFKTLSGILSFSYISMNYCIVFALFALAVSGQHMALQRFAISFLLCLASVAVLPTLWPAVGGYVFYDVQVQQLGTFPAAARLHEADLLALRDGSLRTLPDRIQGIITFPSFHASVGVLLVHALRPLAFVGLPLAVLNLLLILSTLADGGHYLMDTIAGAPIGILSIFLANRWVASAPTSKKQVAGSPMSR
jgi:hypothetical protein